MILIMTLACAVAVLLGAALVVIRLTDCANRLRSRVRGSAAVIEKGLPPSIPLRITNHARIRMRERGVLQSDLEATLRMPDRVRVDPNQRSIRFEKDYPCGTLKVWVAQCERTTWPTDVAVVKSTAWSFRTELTVRAEDVGRIIGKGGQRVKRIQALTGARVHFTEDHVVLVTAGERVQLEQAMAMIRESTQDSQRRRRAA